METLVRLSFYCFAAATIAFAASALCYVAYAIGRVRLRQTTPATNAGTTMVAHEASLEPASLGIGRFATLLAWFGVAFQVASILFRTVAGGRLPLSNMYEFSCTFVLFASVVYLHTRSLRGWRGSRSAVILLVAFAAVVFTYFGNYVFGGLHAYGGV